MDVVKGYQRGKPLVSLRVESLIGRRNTAVNIKSILESYWSKLRSEITFFLTINGEKLEKSHNYGKKFFLLKMFDLG